VPSIVRCGWGGANTLFDISLKVFPTGLNIFSVFRTGKRREAATTLSDGGLGNVLRHSAQELAVEHPDRVPRNLMKGREGSRYGLRFGATFHGLFRQRK
jgi:hypothetical protein